MCRGKHGERECRRFKTAMLEKVDAGIDVLLEDLTVGHVSSWQQWAIAGNSRDTENGGYYLRVDTASSAASPLMTMGKHSDLLSQVFLFVRGGGPADISGERQCGQEGGGVRQSGRRLRFVSDSRVRTDMAAITVPSHGALIMTIPGPGAITVYRMP